MAAFAKSWRREVVVEAGILPASNGKTTRSWRGIVPFTRLAREGRMTVTIGRRELLAGLGGAAVARPLAARTAQQPGGDSLCHRHQRNDDGVPDNFDSDADEAIAGRPAVSGSARKAMCLCKFTR